MRKASYLIVLVAFGVLVAACAPPPPLKSDKYLNDTSLVTSDSCQQPCFKTIVVGKTTFADAVSKIKADTTFSNVQTQDRTSDNPAQAAWATDKGEQCCNMIEDKTSGLVQAVLVRLAPTMTIDQVIKKQGNPQFVLAGDYSSSESVIQLVYPDKGNIVWVVPGDANSTLTENNPVVAVLYLDPSQLNTLLTQTNLQGWDGYKAYKVYKDATPIRTALPTGTAAPAGATAAATSAATASK